MFGWPKHSRNYWGTIFQSMLHLMHRSVLMDIFFVFSNFLFEINPSFYHLRYCEIIVNAYMNVFIYLFFNLLARNPLVWWIHVCGNLDIVNFFFLYTSFAASLRWCAFTIKHSEIIWFSRRYFRVFF